MSLAPTLQSMAANICNNSLRRGRTWRLPRLPLVAYCCEEGLATIAARLDEILANLLGWLLRILTSRSGISIGDPLTHSQRRALKFCWNHQPQVAEVINVDDFAPEQLVNRGHMSAKISPANAAWILAVPRMSLIEARDALWSR